MNPQAPDPEAQDADRVEKKVDQTLGALVDLISEVLTTRSPAKFQQVAQLCDVGQALQATKGRTLKDFLGQDEQNQGMYGANYVMPRRRYGGLVGPVVGGAGLYDVNPMPAGNLDQNQIARDALMMVKDQTDGRKASLEAEELRDLMAVIKDVKEDDPNRVVLQDRINKLVDNIKERNEHAAAEERERVLRERAGFGIGVQEIVPVVPADVPRGHQAGIEGQAPDLPPRLRADPDGEGGHANPPHSRLEGAIVAQPRQDTLGDGEGVPLPL